jgi:hypothetical protein
MAPALQQRKMDKVAIFSCSQEQLDSYKTTFNPGEFSRAMRQLADAAVALRLKKRSKTKN